MPDQVRHGRLKLSNFLNCDAVSRGSGKRVAGQAVNPPLQRRTQMTRLGRSELTCPQCRNRQETDLYHSINVGLNPELRERLFNGEINVFKCESCKTIAAIGQPLLYNDMKRRYCVQYFPPDLLKEDEFLRQYSAEGKLKMEGSIDSISEHSRYLLVPHIVFDLKEMVYYIEFRDRLFDIYEKT
jgi:hypothetical protein